MGSPFPGMDPFLELPAYWSDFHATFVNYWREAIADQLPPQYEATVGERVYLVENLEGPRETYIEILHQPQRTLVTALELLSPANKEPSGRTAYVAKRRTMLLQQANLVELDLLIEGRHLPSPVSVEHGDMDGDVGTWLGVHKAFTPGTASGHNTTSFLLDDTPQSDVNLRILPSHGGASWEEDAYLHGVPELLAEVCRSSAAYDLHAKLDLYQAAKVPEYLAVLLFEQEIRRHILEDGKYVVLSPDADGLWRSGVFSGLWLDGKALLAGDLRRVLTRLDQGLQSVEHQQFVARLAASKR